MRPVLEVKSIFTAQPLQCYLCEGVIQGDCSRLVWSGPVLGFGYFHTKVCSEAMIKRMQGDCEVVYSEVKRKSGT